MPIQRIPSRLHQYMRAFDLAAIARRGRRLIITSDPAGADAAWWVPRDKAKLVLKRARQLGGNVVGAALAIDVFSITAHERVVARASAAVAMLEQRLAEAKAKGAVGFLNREYRRRRIEAQENGEPFPPYRVVETRLQQALAAKLTGDQRGLIAQVFDASR